MKKLKVAFVSPYPPSQGTLNEYGFHLIEQLKMKDEIGEIVLITDQLPEGEQYSVESMPECHIKTRDVWNFNDPLSTIKILKTVREERPDIVMFNIHFMTFGDKKIPAALGLAAPMLCRMFGYPAVVLLHNIVESVDLSSAGFASNRLSQWLYRMIATILTSLLLTSNLVAVTISKYVEILKDKYGVRNVALIPHGSFETPEEPSFDREEGPVKIMTFGKFGTYKKIEMLVEAVEHLRSEGHEGLEIVVAGTDSPNCIGYLEEMKQQYAHVPGLQFTGYVPEEDVPRVFGESTVVVFPYTSTTGSSGVLHQAGSYGKACALPNIGDLKMLIEEEGYTGAYFQPEDHKSLAGALEKLLNNDGLRKSQAQQNFAASASLPMTDIADWYVGHFEYLLSK